MALEFNDWVQSQGFDAGTLSEPQRLALRSAWRRDIAANEAGREQLVEQYMHDAGPSTDAVRVAAERAQTLGYDLRRTELDLMRASRSSIPATMAPSGPGTAHGQDVLTAALMVSHGFAERDVGQHFTPAVMDRAVSGGMRRLTLNGMMRLVAQSAGCRVSPGRFSNDDIRTVFEAGGGPRAGGGPSGISVSGILSNLASKAMLMSYGTVGTVWQRFCRMATDVQDFKPFKRYRLTVKGTFEEVAGGGELRHVSLSEFEAEHKLAQYGCIIGLDRKDIINDDLSAFAAIPRSLGRLGAVTLERAVFTTLLANPGSFFSTVNKNYITGTQGILGDEALTAAYQKFQEQTDDNGDPILVPPRVILVPPSLEKVARKLTRDTGVVVAGDTDRTEPNGNPWAGMFDPVCSPYLGAALGLPGASDTGWYLTAAPGDFSPVEVAFLQGAMTPTVEAGEMDFDRLGMSFRAYHDWGVALLEPRGAVYSTGAVA